MGFAGAVGCPVVLVGDIERGGVIGLVGTAAVIGPIGYVLGSWLTNSAATSASSLTVWRKSRAGQLGCFGCGAMVRGCVAPAGGSSVGLSRSGTVGAGNKTIKVAVPALSRSRISTISPTASAGAFGHRQDRRGRQAPAEEDADVVLLAGSKAALIADLHHFRAQGWDIDLARMSGVAAMCWGSAAATRCSGAASRIPPASRSRPAPPLGLGLLDVDIAAEDKTVPPDIGVGLRRHPDRGYRNHVVGGPPVDAMRPMLRLETPEEAGGRARGPRWPGRRLLCPWPSRLRCVPPRMAGPHRRDGDPLLDAGAVVEETLDGLAVHLEATLDLDRLADLARPIGRLWCRPVSLPPGD